MVEEAFNRAISHAFAQVPQVNGGRDAAHTGNQGTVFYVKRHIGFFGFPIHIFRNVMSLFYNVQSSCIGIREKAGPARIYYKQSRY